jgi:hypothetical protein
LYSKFKNILLDSLKLIHLTNVQIPKCFTIYAFVIDFWI